jgi:hypothetical protein
MEDGDMKKKALVVVLLCVMGLAALSINNAEAGGWYTCTVSQAGATTWGYLVTLSDTVAPPNNAFPANTPFLITTVANTKEMYAAALSAWANSTYVVVYLETLGEYSSIWGVKASH